MNEDAPMYIKIEDFTELTNLIGEIRDKTDKVREKLLELKDLRQNEASAVRDWETRINNLSAKVSAVERSLSNRG